MLDSDLTARRIGYRVHPLTLNGIDPGCAQETDPQQVQMASAGFRPLIWTPNSPAAGSSLLEGLRRPARLKNNMPLEHATPMEAPLIDQILELREPVTVVLHVSGRIRLRVDRKVTAQFPRLDGSQVASSLGAVRGIRSTQLNVVAASLIIHYDPRVIAPSAWEDLLQGDGSQVARAIGLLKTHLSELDLAELTGEST
jgi:hypothetical protein